MQMLSGRSYLRGRPRSTGAIHPLAVKCSSCGGFQEEARTVCSRCGGVDTFEAARLSRRATLYSVTRIWRSVFGSTEPYSVGFVDFPEGVRLVGRLAPAEGDTPGIGAILKPVLRSFNWNGEAEPSDCLMFVLASQEDTPDD